MTPYRAIAPENREFSLNTTVIRNFSITPGKMVGQLVAHSQANGLVRNL
jgi:hypothetical protein